jgi:hypothetical protein
MVEPDLEADRERLAARIEADYPNVDLGLDRVVDRERRFGRFLRTVATGVDWAIGHYAIAGGALALLAGGFYTLAYAKFYSALGVSPEQAGLTTSAILTHSVLGGLALVTLIALTFSALFIPAVGPRGEYHGGPGTWSDFGSNVFITVAALGLMWFVFKLTGAPLALGLLFSVISGALALFVSLTFRYEGLLPKPVQFEFIWEAYVVFIVAAAIPVGLLGAGLGTFLRAEELGTEAGSGGAVRNPEIAGLPFIGVQALPAFVDWLDPRENRQLPHCLLYLGNSDGQMALYDAESGAAIEAPNREAVVHLRNARSSCDAPVSISPPPVRPIARGNYLCGHGGWDSRPPHPDFTYRWTTKGEFMAAVPSADTARLVSRQVVNRLEPLTSIAVRCEVTASTGLGRDSALSSAITVGR